MKLVDRHGYRIEGNSKSSSIPFSNASLDARLLSGWSRDETRNPGLYYRVEPVSDLNSVNLVNSSFWNLSDIVVLASSIQSFRGGKDGRSTLDRPGKQDLGWSQRGLPGDGQNGRIFEWARSHPVT
jgi:hypothetical protein